MNESNSIETIDRTNLTDETKFRFDKVGNIETYFHEEINQIKLCSKKLSKYVAAFDYIDNILIVLSATTEGVSICLFLSKLNSIETLISQALIDMEISHKEFVTILKEKR